MGVSARFFRLYRYHVNMSCAVKMYRVSLKYNVDSEKHFRVGIPTKSHSISDYTHKFPKVLKRN